MATVKISLRISTELAARVSKFARELGLNESDAMRAAMARGVEEHDASKALSEVLFHAAVSSLLLREITEPDVVKKIEASARSIVEKITGEAS
ncbi:MAG: hypothetical protein AAB879_02305 [Patescibacteria group bacterium]